MPALDSPFVWFGAVAVAVGLGIAAVAWRQRDARGARVYAVMMALTAAWSALYVGQLLQPTVAGKRPWLLARHAITPLFGVLFWVFAAQYVDRRDLLSARYLGPILGVGAVLTLTVVVPGGLYVRDLSLYTAGSTPRAVVDFGPAFWLTALYIVVTVGAGHSFLLATLLDSFSVYRRQLTAIAVVGVIEFALLLVFISEHVDVAPSLNPWPHVQLITYNTVFVAAPLGWSYVRQSLFDIELLDRQAVIENMDDAVFVFDTDGVLRRVNDHGQRLVASAERSRTEDADPRVRGEDVDLEGQSATGVLSASPALLDAYREGTGTAADGEEGLAGGTAGASEATARATDTTSEPTESAAVPVGDGQGAEEPVGIDMEGERRWFDIRVSSIENSVGERTGTMLVARDVTDKHRHRRMLRERKRELERKTERLERQNERLDEFASVVSHDLRNPLMVVGGHLDLVREEIPESSAETMEANVDRMERMIDGLLTMARAGKTVESTEPVKLADLATTAWRHADTDGHDLAVELPEETTVQADRDRLLHVFENLFRNSVEHGSTGSRTESDDSVEHGSTGSRPAADDSVEHGSTGSRTESDDSVEEEGPSVTVRVSHLDPDEDRATGFFVEDDGRGIPDGERADVFDHGYTTTDGGTGLGLSIVTDIVEAHGWEIRAVEGATGGARFEITGVELECRE